MRIWLAIGIIVLLAIIIVPAGMWHYRNALLHLQLTRDAVVTSTKK